MQEVRLRIPIRIEKGDDVKIFLLDKYGKDEGFEPVLTKHLDVLYFWGMKKK